MIRRRGLKEVVIVLYVLLMVISTLFYRLSSSWNFVTSIYFSCQIIFGEMMDTPHVEAMYVKFFTLILYIFGQGLLLSAFSSLYSTTIENIKLESHQKKYADMLSNLSITTTSKPSTVYSNKLSVQSMLTIITLIWFILGVIYAKIYDQKDIITSIYWSLSLISCSGDAPPVCEQSDPDKPCSISQIRVLFMVVFITVGVPLFSVTLGSICTLKVLTDAYEYEENKKIENPFNDDEIRFALSLDSKRKQYYNSRKGNYADEDDDGIDTSSFIVIELLRLKKVTQEDIARYLSLFEKIDDANKGVVTKAAIDSYVSKISESSDDSNISSIKGGSGGYESITDTSESEKLHHSFNALIRVASSKRLLSHH